MNKKTRRYKIEEILISQQQVTIRQLAKMLSVSEMTIRRDLKELEKEQKIFLVKGGAVYRQPISKEEDYRVKQMHSEDNKDKISQKAYELITHEDVIILDAGTTTYKLAQKLTDNKYDRLTIISNDINIVHLLANRTKYRLILIGGKIEPSTISAIGSMAEEQMKRLHADKAFIGTSSLDADLNFYSPTEEKTILKNLFIQNSDTTVLLCDSSKFDRKNLFYINNAKNFSYFISDYKFKQNMLKEFEKNHLTYIRI